MKQKFKILSRSDEIFLLAILKLGEEAYGVTIKKEILEKTGKNLTFGSLWVSLDILHQRGLISKRQADPTPKRGGRSKIYYKLTEKGLITLETTYKLQQNLWQDVLKAIKEYR